ncbi:hypothetical protein [Nitratifractor sp.]
MKRFIGSLIVAPLLLLTACGPTSPRPLPVHKSLYLGKPYMKFVMDNGPSYRDEKLPDGSTIHYWRSDFGNLIAVATGRDDSGEDYCELALRTNPEKTVERIQILQESLRCNGVLK